MKPANVNTVDVAVVQAASVLFDADACIDKAIRLIGEAAATGAKVIVFPEAFVTGYPEGSQLWPRRRRPRPGRS